MNRIERDIYVLQQSFIADIEYVRATNAIPLVFYFRDFTIPSGATAKIFCSKPSGKAVYSDAVIDGNTVTVDVTTQMFIEPGYTNVQIRIKKDEDVLVTFAVRVFVKENYTDGDYPPSKNEGGIFDEAEQAISDANTAAQGANDAAGRANDAAAAVEGAVAGVINDAAESSLTTYSSEKIEDEFIKKAGDASGAIVTFETALQRANIQSGDSLATAFGKLAKFCADLDEHAFSEPVTDLTSDDSTKALAASAGKQLKDEIGDLTQLPTTDKSSLVAALTEQNSALASMIYGLGGGRVEFYYRQYAAGEIYINGEKINARCNILYMRMYSSDTRSVFIGTMMSSDDGTVYSKYVASPKLLVLKQIDSNWYGWSSIALEQNS